MKQLLLGWVLCLNLFFLIFNYFFLNQACKLTLRYISTLMDAPKMNEMIQSHLLDHGQLNYEHFIIDFIIVLVSSYFMVLNE